INKFFSINSSFPQVLNTIEQYNDRGEALVKEIKEDNERLITLQKQYEEEYGNTVPNLLEQEMKKANDIPLLFNSPKYKEFIIESFPKEVSLAKESAPSYSWVWTNPIVFNAFSKGSEKFLKIKGNNVVGFNKSSDEVPSSLWIPAGVQGIKEAAFMECKGIEYVYCPGTLIKIDDYAVDFCENLKYVFCDEGLKTIGTSAFSSCAFQSFIVPETVQTIGSSAFSGCERLVSVFFPNSLLELKSYMFANCGQLSEFTIPTSVEKIGYGVFRNCDSLRKLIIHNSLREFAIKQDYMTDPKTKKPFPFNCEGAFTQYKGIVEIGNDCTSIPKHAFYNAHCASVIIPNSVSQVDKQSFIKEGYERGLGSVRISISWNSPLNNVFNLKAVDNGVFYDKDYNVSCKRS
ncbi:MAG: leucine-rich repeat domain-containing protein, partial [Spirochaetales bacterium]|nr:leucine-rich repeat domain-containing protein [Spirochaetales bacterium]